VTQQALSRQNGAFMKIVLIGANGKIGELVQTAMAGAGHEIVKVGRKSGDFEVDIESRESIRQLYQVVGSFDAVAVAAGEVVFAPLSQLTAENWQFSLGSKLMGQISLVQEAIPFINERDLSPWFRAFLMKNRSSPVSRVLLSRAHWKVLFGLPPSNFPRD